MHRVPFLLAFGLIALLGTHANAQFKGKGKEASASKYGWLSSLADGRSEANASGKPMMVVLRCVP